MTLYAKKGRRYVPVAMEDEWDAWPHGSHLVVSHPKGGRLTRFNIDPDHAALIAAVEPLRDKIKAVVVHHLAMRPTKRPVTLEQQAAWNRFSKAMGNDRFIVEYPSVAELADAVVGLLVEAAHKNECPPTPS